MEEMELSSARVRQERVDNAARAYRLELQIANENQQIQSRCESARQTLRENDPSSAGLREAEVAAARARTLALVAELPGTQEEIFERLSQRAAELEGPAAPEDHEGPE